VEQVSAYRSRPDRRSNYIEQRTYVAIVIHNIFLALNQMVDVGTEVPFTVRLSDLGGVNYALIAVQSPIPTELPQQTRFKDALSPFSKDVGNWRDYYDWISTDKSTTFYNVSKYSLEKSCESNETKQTVVADPTSPVISITTRLRMFEDDSSITSVDVMLLFEVRNYT
jgi:hypothetical protein